MSYVIQNYSQYRNKMTITPRFKTFLVFKSFFTFFVFFQFFIIEKKTSFNYPLLNFFFTSGIYNFFYECLKPVFTVYTNKTKNTVSYYVLKKMNDYFYLKKKSTITYLMANILILNLYLLSLKISNFTLRHTFYKSFFFFFLFSNSYLWYQHHNYLKFYLNFFLYNHNLKFYKFYSGYFFKVYNF